MPIISVPQDVLTWTPQPMESAQGHVLPSVALTWTPQGLSSSSLVSSALPAGSLTWTAKAPQFILEPTSPRQSRVVYRAYLTGDAETPPISDLELPLASFQSTRRNGESTYLFIVVPNPMPYIAGMNARLNGDVVIQNGFALGDTETLTELLRVNFESFRYDLGARSGSASLSGHKQVTYSNPKTRRLLGISYKNVTDGLRRVRCEPDMWLNPGDTADVGGGETFVVDAISYSVTPRQATMEVSEVEA